MSENNKFEQLIELFIAEDEQGAKDLFHEIVVEKSRDIYEGLVDEDQVEETPHGQTLRSRTFRIALLEGAPLILLLRLPKGALHLATSREVEVILPGPGAPDCL